MSSNFLKRPTWAEIDLDNLAFNFHSVKNFVGKNLGFMAVVKANGYGHGAIPCARRLEKEGIDWFGVALPTEGLQLRQNGITKPILCLGSFWPGQENLILENLLTPVIYQTEIARIFNRAAKEKRKKANIHIKIDTGMGRIGLRPDECSDFIEQLKGFENLNVEGIMTHFPVADDLNENDFTDHQIEIFYEILNDFEKAGFRPKFKDLANSPGAIAHENSLGNLVRLGGVLYGLGDDVLPKGIEKPGLKPVLSIYTRIAHLKKVPKGETLGYGRTFKTSRDSLIATIPIGYQDGYVRALSNRGRVIINGQFIPIVGRISMDWTILDVTDLKKVKVGDRVILLGQVGDQKITAEEIAKINQTISYEITCGINRRVTRKYVETEKKQMV